MLGPIVNKDTLMSYYCYYYQQQQHY